MAITKSGKRTILPLSSALYTPGQQTPCRCTLRHHSANTQIALHSHPWVQMMFCSQGAMRVYANKRAFMVLPGRAAWIPPGTQHEITVLKEVRVHSLFLIKDESATGWQHRDKWAQSHVIEVCPLLRELIIALADSDCDRLCSDQYPSLAKLALLEIQRSSILLPGISYPSERRVRMLCENFLQDPRIDRSLADLAQSAGAASVSTINRLFHREIGCSFSQWRGQALLSQAQALAAAGFSVSQIAFRLGYSSLSAFSYMITQLAGIPPAKLFKKLARKDKAL